MSKKLITTAIGIVVVAAGGYFGASRLGLLGSSFPSEAEAMAEITCACKDFDCTLPQTQWFNKNSIRFRNEIKALSEADAARYSAAHDKNSECQNKLRP